MLTCILIVPAPRLQNQTLALFAEGSTTLKASPKNPHRLALPQPVTNAMPHPMLHLTVRILRDKTGKRIRLVLLGRPFLFE